MGRPSGGAVVFDTQAHQQSRWLSVLFHNSGAGAAQGWLVLDVGKVGENLQVRQGTDLFRDKPKVRFDKQNPK